MKLFKQFYKRPLTQRKEVLKESFKIQDEDYKNLEFAVADNMIENAIGIYEVPLGIAPNFLINNKEYVVPMATEEPSVIAAASNGAKTIAASGGFKAVVHDKAMIGQIAFHNPLDINTYDDYIQNSSSELYELAKQAHPSIHRRGGGLESIFTKYIAEANLTPFYIVYFKINTLEAMGANIVNTILEAIKPHLETVFGLESVMSIISNDGSDSLVTVTCEIDPVIAGLSEKACELFQIASDLAVVDPYRTVTHNKGIMNGVVAVTLASGNDTRAIEAGAHAYAARNGKYEPLATWSYQDGKLKGQLTLPLALGAVGSSMKLHPKVQLGHKILQLQNCQELMMVTASVGLAQNFAALKALTSVGIQQGHMGLQARALLTSAGVGADDMDIALDLIQQEDSISSASAQSVYNKIKESKSNL